MLLHQLELDTTTLEWNQCQMIIFMEAAFKPQTRERMDLTDTETQAPDDFQDLETCYNSPPALAQECRTFKWKVQLIDDDGNIEDQSLTTRDVWKLQNRKVIVHFDEDCGQPDEDSGGLLGSWLGQLSTDLNLLPINYSDWRTLPSHRKEKAWEVIEAKFCFDDPPTRRSYVISLLGNRCKDVKLRLWRDHKRNSQTETIANRPTHVPEDQWNDFVCTRFTEKWKKKQKQNTISRKKHIMPHNCGRKSFARNRRAMKNLTGKIPSRAEFFIKTRTKSDGSFVSDEAKKRADELTILMSQNPSTQITTNFTASLDDEFSLVFGPERSGRVRCVGRGPTPSKLTKRCAAVRAEADYAEKVQMRTNMKAMQNQVENLTVVIQQLLSARAGDQVSTLAAYASILNPNPSTSEVRRDEVNRNQNDDNHNGEDH